MLLKLFQVFNNVPWCQVKTLLGGGNFIGMSLLQNSAGEGFMGGLTAAAALRLDSKPRSVSPGMFEVLQPRKRRILQKAWGTSFSD